MPPSILSLATHKKRGPMLTHKPSQYMKKNYYNLD